MATSKGFTVIEIAIFLALAAIVTAVSVPILSSSMQSWQLEADARNIASSMTYAKLSATSHMTHTRLSFDLERNEWFLQKYDRNSGVYQRDGDVVQLSSGMANSGISFRGSAASAPAGFPATSSTSVTFNSRGFPVDESNAPTPDNVLYLSGGGSDFAVTVSLSGKVQLWKYRNRQWVPE